MKEENAQGSESPGLASPILDLMSDQIERWKVKGDKRYLFLSCYATMTGNMLRAIEGDEFHDSAWVLKLLNRFAEYYFEALEHCSTGSPDRPRIWEYTYRTTKACDLHVMQSILLGINAHINYDLVLTLHELLSPDWDVMTNDLKITRHEDHLKVNEIIARTIDTVQDEIIEKESPIMDIIDRVMGRSDEYLLSLLIKRWRREVWNAFQSMLETRDPEIHERVRSHVEARAMSIAHHILLR